MPDVPHDPDEIRKALTLAASKISAQASFDTAELSQSHPALAHLARNLEEAASQVQQLASSPLRTDQGLSDKIEP